MTDRQALEQIVALAEQAKRISPPVSTIGHPDGRVDLFEQAVKIARRALEDGRRMTRGSA